MSYLSNVLVGTSSVSKVRIDLELRSIEPGTKPRVERQVTDLVW